MTDPHEPIPLRRRPRRRRRAARRRDLIDAASATAADVGRADDRGRSMADLERVATERDEYLDARRADPGRLRELPQAGRSAPAEDAGRAGRRRRSSSACSRCSTPATPPWPTARPRSSRSSAPLLGALEKEGLERIDPIGEPFDPNQHEAVMHEPTATAASTSSSEVLRAGYAWKGRVLRPAMVKVTRLERDTPMAPQREWFEKDYYEVLGVPDDGHQPRRSRARTASWPGRTTPTPTPVTPRRRSASRRSPPPTTWSATPSKRKEYDEVRRLGPGGRPASRRRRVGRLQLPGRRRPRRPARRPVRRARATAAAAHAAAVPTGARTSRPSCTCSFDGRGRRRHHRGPPHQRRPVHHLPRHRARAGHHARTCANCGGRGVVDDNQGLFSLQPPCPACGGRGVIDRRPVPHLPRHRRRAPAPRGQGADPAGRQRRPAHPAQGPRRPRPQRRPARRPLRRRPRRAPPAVRAQGQRPHPHRARHVPRGRPGRRHHGADPRRPARHAPHPAGHPHRAAPSG